MKPTVYAPSAGKVLNSAVVAWVTFTSGEVALNPTNSDPSDPQTEPLGSPTKGASASHSACRRST